MSASAPSPFAARTAAILVALGIAAFIATLVLGAYAPDLQSGRNGGGHALSDGATGYSALVELATATGRNPRIVRDPRLFTTPDLLVATPERGSVNISAALSDRDYKPTLFVLPKWDTAPDPDRDGWVRRKGLLSLDEAVGVLRPFATFTMRRERVQGRMLNTSGLPAAVRLRAPAALQVITDAKFSVSRTDDEAPPIPRLIPLVTDGAGGIVLAKLGDAPRFVLADPDLLDNLGMRDVAQAAGALAMLDALDPRPDRGIAFDVSFNGLGRTQNPLKLLFEPPFLALTLTLGAALLLIALSALARFGPVLPRPRAVAYGKAALVDNTAALVARARRQGAMGARYAAVMRERAARRFGAPPRLHDAALAAYLDTLGTTPRFTDLAGTVETADTRTLADAARALHAWPAPITGRQT